MAKGYKQRLKSMQENWGDSQKEFEDMFGGAQLPKAEYSFKLIKLDIRESGNNNLYIERQQVVMDGEFEDTNIKDALMLGSPKNMVFVRRFVEQMGYDCPEELEELPDVLDAIVSEAPTYNGSLSYYNDRAQVRVIELLDGDGDGEEDGEEDTSEEDGEEDTSEENGEEDTSEEDTSEEENEAAGDDDGELIDRMLIFCATWDIEVDEENADFDTLKEAISTNEYAEKELDDDETAVLIDCELESCIIKPKKKKAAVKKSVKKSSKKKK